MVVEVTLRERPARLSVHAPAGAEIAIDGRPVVGVLPLARPLEVAAGTHFLTVGKRGHYAYTRELRLERGQSLAVDAPLERTTQRAVSYWVLGAARVALAAGATTTTLAFVYQGNAEDVLDAKATDQINQAQLDEYNRERGARDDMATASYVLYGGALALAATGALLYIVDTPRAGVPGEAPTESPGEDLELAPTVGPEGMMGAVVTGTF